MEENIKIDKKEGSRGRRSFIVITRKCINDCLFCTERPRANWPDPTTKELKEILAKDCKSFSYIVFTGGEPTLHKDICELIEYAKRLGYRVTLFTNGRLFSNPELTKKIAKTGLDAVLIPLHGYPAEIHDRITQRPGSFKQTISGLKNLALYNIEIQVKIIPNKINYKILPNLASFIAPLPYVDFVAMDMLAVGGNALKNKEIISTKLSIMAPYMEEALDILIAAGKPIQVTSLPLCLVKPEYWKYISDSRTKEEIQVGLNKDKRGSSVTYTGQALAPACQNCFLKEKCPGTWPTYFRVYGDSELKPVIGPPHSCF